jgi:hypothetical protein
MITPFAVDEVGILSEGTMRTNCDGMQINPHGLRVVGSQTTVSSKEILVSVKGKALAYFKDRNGHSYVCVFLNADKPRAAFVDKGQGYEEMEDQALALTIARMTDEIVVERTK